MPNKFHYGNGYNSVNSIAIIWSIEDGRRRGVGFGGFDHDSESE